MDEDSGRGGGGGGGRLFKGGDYFKITFCKNNISIQGGEILKKVVNRGAAIIRGNMV